MEINKIWFHSLKEIEMHRKYMQEDQVNEMTSLQGFILRMLSEATIFLVH